MRRVNKKTKEKSNKYRALDWTEVNDRAMSDNRRYDDRAPGELNQEQINAVCAVLKEEYRWRLKQFGRTALAKGKEAFDAGGTRRK